MLRRLYPDQPESFAFTEANYEWALGQISKFPEGRQASAVIPLLWRAQEQEGWLTRPAIEEVARILDMAYIRVLEVATFYFMFQLQPVGSVAHIQICGTTSCMICGAEDLMRVCQEKIAPEPHQISEDGKFSWEEVECLGACSNAPMAQIGKDYYEDLTEESLAGIIDAMARGEVPTPGPQNGRWGSEPKDGPKILGGERAEEANVSVARAVQFDDTIARIDGPQGEVRFYREVENHQANVGPLEPYQAEEADGPKVSGDAPVSEDGVSVQETDVDRVARPGDETASEDAEDVKKAEAATESKGDKAKTTKDTAGVAKGKASEKKGAAKKDSAQKETAKKAAETAESEDKPQKKPETLDGARDGNADDLKKINGVGPKLEALLNSLGFYHFDQIANWTDEEVNWVDENLEGFKGRIERDEWVKQAKALAAET
ncbi:NADH-quinone oxidoreductase subunit NuoE [Paracoccaceae bacterium GXU_MW_L88]